MLEEDWCSGIFISCTQAAFVAIYSVTHIFDGRLMYTILVSAFRVHTRSAGTSLCAVTMNQLLGPGLTNLPICIDHVLDKKQHALLTLMSYLVLSDLHGDRPRPLPKIKELQGATDITDRKGSPSWDYDVCTHVLSSVIISILSHD